MSKSLRESALLAWRQAYPRRTGGRRRERTDGLVEKADTARLIPRQSALPCSFGITTHNNVGYAAAAASRDRVVSGERHGRYGDSTLKPLRGAIDGMKERRELDRGAEANGTATRLRPDCALGLLHGARCGET